MLNLDEFHRDKQHILGEQFVKKSIAQNVYYMIAKHVERLKECRLTKRDSACSC